MSQRTSTGRRRGAALYMIVVSTTLIVGVLGLSALLVTRIERRSSQNAADLAAARLYARAAVEWAMLRMKTNPAWRTTYVNGVWELDRPIGRGTFSLEVVDPNDGDLANSPTDSIVVKSVGKAGDARHRLQVTLAAESAGLSCLEVGVHAGTDVNFSGASGIDGDAIISANNAMIASGNPVINNSLESVNGFTGSFGPGSITAGITPREMPDPGTVYDEYIAQGTALSITSLPMSGGKRSITTALLSPTSNPYGSVNGKGIYVIDCQGASVTIDKCRIVGTLVMLNAGAGVQIDGPVHWQQAVANYPSLLVQGPLTLGYSSSAQLYENPPVAVNFNPLGTPYLGGSDADTVDSYPTLVMGLVYASGTILVGNANPRFEGVLVSGTNIEFNAWAEMFSDREFSDNPPPGFIGVPAMHVSTGSWQQVVD